jgi:methionine-rich copper-binding protein CopC
MEGDPMSFLPAKGARAAALVVWFGLVLWAGPASSHATLLATEPADGAVLTSAPGVMVLRFGDPVAPISAQILGSNGIKFPVEMRVENETVHLALPQGLSTGAYVVSWRVNAFDDHPVTGSLMFVVGAAPAGARASEGAGKGVSVQREDHGRSAEIEVTPAVAGRNRIVARLGLKTAPMEVAIELSQKDAGIEPLRRVLQLRDGAYMLDGPELLVPGLWSFTLDVLVTDFDKAFFDAEIPIR